MKQQLIQTTDCEHDRFIFLNKIMKKQKFRVSVGRSKWIDFIFTDNWRNWNLREVLKDEIVIEFDMPDDWKGDIKEFQKQISFPAINATGINLLKAGFSFEVWEHGGKSPHLHIHNLPIAHLPKVKLREFKKFFIKKYVPEEYLEWVDFSLCGIHLVALEWAFHWKGKYGYKILLNKFNPNQLNKPMVIRQ